MAGRRLGLARVAGVTLPGGPGGGAPLTGARPARRGGRHRCAGRGRVPPVSPDRQIRPLAELKLGLAGLGDHLDLDVGAYGDVHEVRAELVAVARRAAAAAYGLDFDGPSTVLVGDTPLDVAAALATGARAVGVATGSFPAADLAAAGAHVVLPDLTDTALLVAAVTGQL